MDWNELKNRLLKSEFHYFHTDKGILLYGDCLDVMSELPEGFIDLIYIDPPYGFELDRKFGMPRWNSTEEHYDFCDKLGLNIIRKVDKKGKKSNYGLAHYIYWIYPRLILMKILLSDQGSIYVHIDWHVGHYVKVIMDEIFGKENFVNEIVWAYKTGGIPEKLGYAKKHDTIYYYSKSKEKTYFNMPKQKSYLDSKFFKPHQKKSKELGIEEDYIGMYRWVECRDVWDDIKSFHPRSSERVNYDTQKPEKLLKRIIISSCPEGGIVADFFAGSGTTGAVAEKLGRRWICCEFNEDACKLIKQRILNLLKNRVSPYTKEEIK